MYLKIIKNILFKFQYYINILIKLNNIRYIKNQKNLIVIYDHGLGGGTTKFVKDNLLMSKNQYYLLFNYKVMQNSIKLSLILNGKVLKSFSSISLNDLKLILSSITINKIIINHLIGFKNIDKLINIILWSADKNNCELDFYLHDYYSLCPTVNLINDKDIFCNVPKNADICNSCLVKNTNIPWFSESSDDIEVWRRSFLDLFNKTKSIFVFSKSSMDIFRKAFLSFDDKLKLHPIVLAKLPKIADVIDFSKNEIVNIGILGNINKIKGLEIIVKLASILPNCYKLNIIGNVDGVLNNVHVSGGYDMSSLVGLVRQIDIFILPSICPETYCYSADEIMQMGFPIICFNIGAPVERVCKYEHGYIVNKVDTYEMKKEIINVAKLYGFRL